MWTNLAAGVFNVPTLEVAALSINDRLTWLRLAIERLVQYRDERMQANPCPRWKPGGLAPSMVLVAPEYMFVPPGFQLVDVNDLKRNRFLSREQHDDIVAEIQRISAHYGRDLVLVPGTIAYREEVPDRPSERKERLDTAKTRIRTAARSLEAYYKAPGESYLDVRLAGPLAGHQSLTPSQKLKALEVAGRYSSTFYTATNIAYMLNNGRIVGSYAKRSDFHERLPGAHANTIFVPGIRPGRATVGGIDFGVEICLDHGLGVLKGTPAVTGDLPRVHMICSATVDFEATSVHVREGGYLHPRFERRGERLDSAQSRRMAAPRRPGTRLGERMGASDGGHRTGSLESTFAPVRQEAVSLLRPGGRSKAETQSRGHQSRGHQSRGHQSRGHQSTNTNKVGVLQST